MFRSSPSAAFALALLSSSLLAQPAPHDDAVVVSASRTEQRIRDAIPHTSVLTRRDIRDSQALDLGSLLRREAGFEFPQTGGLGGNTSVFVRGGRGAQTLVLIDGMRIEDTGFGTTALQHIMLDDVERIEIVRGNVSSLYGSGAIGGVVQVFTRRGGRDHGVSADFTYGSWNTSKLHAGYSASHGDTRISVSGMRLHTAGFSAIDTSIAPTANSDDDGYRNDSIAASVSHRLVANHEIGASLYRVRSKVDYDLTGAPTVIHQADQELGMSQVFWQAQWLESWKSRLSLGEGTDYRTDLRNGAFSSNSNSRSRQMIWDNDVRLAPEHQVSVGIERLEQKLQNSSVGNRARDADVARLGYLGRLGAHSLQANVRTEEYSDFGRADTYFLGYGFDLTDAWRFTASTSTAFRAPTFQDLFGFGGNPALRPERARSKELGMQWAEGPNRVRLVAFDTAYQDAITFDNATFTIRNVRKAAVQGFEGSYSGRIAGFDVRASATVQDAVEQEPGGIELSAVRRAQKFGSLAAFRSFGRWRLGGEVLASGERPDTNIVAPFNRLQNGAYTVLNLMARYEVDKHLYVAARLENALDEKYQLVYGFNTAGRGLFVTVGWQP
jgi:vitamin B12 transporter